MERIVIQRISRGCQRGVMNRAAMKALIKKN